MSETVRTSTKALSEAASNASEALEDATETAAETAAKTTETIAESADATPSAPQIVKTQELKMTKNTQFFENIASDVANANKEGVEALIASGTKFFKGLEDLSKTMMGISQETTQKSTEAMKTLLGCRTINEFTEAQTKICQESFDDMVKNTSKLSETCIKVANECSAPLNEQVTKAMKKAGKAA
ncbi:MAG: phasin family protein [Pseudobdellovibrionaceae bacterium]